MSRVLFIKDIVLKNLLWRVDKGSSLVRTKPLGGVDQQHSF